MSKAEIIAYDRIAEALLKKVQIARTLTVSTTNLSINIDSLLGRLELEVAGNMIIADISAMLKEIDVKLEQLALIAELLEEE